jgi:hypothetical protein
MFPSGSHLRGRGGMEFRAILLRILLENKSFLALAKIFCILQKGQYSCPLIGKFFDWQARMDRNTTITNVKALANIAADAICLFLAKTKKRK